MDDIPRNLLVGGPLRYNFESKWSISWAGVVGMAVEAVVGTVTVTVVGTMIGGCSVNLTPLSAKAYVEGRRVHNVDAKRLMMVTPTKVKQPKKIRRGFAKKTSLYDETMLPVRAVPAVGSITTCWDGGVNCLYKRA